MKLPNKYGFKKTNPCFLQKCWEVVRLGAQRIAVRHEESPQPRLRTRMPRIGRIFTDTHYPWVSAQSVFYPMDNKPQRAQRTQRKVETLCALCVLCGRLILSTAMDFGKTTHRKGCKERKAAQQESLRPLHSLRFNVFFAPLQPAVHSRSSRAGGYIGQEG